MQGRCTNIENLPHLLTISYYANIASICIVCPVELTTSVLFIHGRLFDEIQFQNKNYLLSRDR